MNKSGEVSASVIKRLPRYYRFLGELMKEKVEALKHMTILNDSVTLASSLREQNIAEVDALADAIAASIVAS